MEWWQKYPAAGRKIGRRTTIAERIRLRRRRRRMNDLDNVRAW